MTIMSRSKAAVGNSDECCPKFDPFAYREGGKNYKVIRWKDKTFVRDGTWCLYYVPLAFEKAMNRALKKISDAGAESPGGDFMVLSESASPWYMNVYVSADADGGGALEEGGDVERISGEFVARAFEGDYSNSSKWVAEMQELVREVRGGEGGSGGETKLYFYYPVCPKCAVKYGANHVVLLARLG